MFIILIFAQIKFVFGIEDNPLMKITTGGEIREGMGSVKTYIPCDQEYPGKDICSLAKEHNIIAMSFESIPQNTNKTIPNLIECYYFYNMFKNHQHIDIDLLYFSFNFSPKKVILFKERRKSGIHYSFCLMDFSSNHFERNNELMENTGGKLIQVEYRTNYIFQGQVLKTLDPKYTEVDDSETNPILPYYPLFSFNKNKELWRLVSGKDNPKFCPKKMIRFGHLGDASIKKIEFNRGTKKIHISYRQNNGEETEQLFSWSKKNHLSYCPEIREKLFATYLCLIEIIPGRAVDVIPMILDHIIFDELAGEQESISSFFDCNIQ